MPLDRLLHYALRKVMSNYVRWLLVGTAIIAAAAVCPAQPSDLPLLISFGSTAVDSGKDVTVDLAGNIIVTGYIGGTADLDPGPDVAPRSSNGVVDVFLAKYTAAGEHLWSFAVGGPGADMPHSVVTDPAGNIHIGGYFTGACSFDPQAAAPSLRSAGRRDCYFAKYTPDGRHVWGVGFGGAENDELNCLAVDETGNTYATGQFEKAITIGERTLVSAGGQDAFVAKLDASGRLLWAIQAGGEGNDQGYGIAVDARGHVYVSGAFRATADFDGGPAVASLTSLGREDAFLACYAADGRLRWAKQIGGEGSDFPGVGAIALDASGDIYLAGMFSGTADLDPGTPAAYRTSGGMSDIFFGRLRNDGSCDWVQAIGGPGLDTVHRIRPDREGHVWLTGSFRGETDFDPGSGTKVLQAASGEGDMFLARYSPRGQLEWAHSFGDSGIRESTTPQPAVDSRRAGAATPVQRRFTTGAGLAIDSSSHAVVTGRFYGTIDFDPSALEAKLTSLGEADAFVARYTPSGGL
jgi:hypothetical protein